MLPRTTIESLSSGKYARYELNPLVVPPWAMTPAVVHQHSHSEPVVTQVGRQHFLQGFRRKQFAAVESLWPPQQIANGAVQASGSIWHARVGIRCVYRPRPVLQVPRCSSRNNEYTRIVPGFVKAQRHKNVLLEVSLIRSSGHLFDHTSRKDVTGVAVIEFFSRREIERASAQPFDMLSRCGGRQSPIPKLRHFGEIWNSGRVGQQME